jgi:uncharacterized membrane protein
MNMNFENNKKLAGEASILLLLSIIPYVGWVLGIIGIVLLLKSMKEFSTYYQDNSIYENSWTGIKYYIVALIAATIAVTAMGIGVASAIGFNLTGLFTFTAGFGIGLIALIAGLVTAFVFYVLAATHLKTTFNILAEKSGDQTFATAGTLLWVGSILTIILVGLVLIFISWIFAAIGFFGMKDRQMPQYAAQAQPYSYSPTQQPAQPTQTSNV